MLHRLSVLAVMVCAVALLATAGDSQEGSVWATKKSSWLLLKPGQREQVFQFAEDYKVYMRAAKSALSSTTEVTKLAKAAGFTEFSNAGQVKPGARLIFPARQRAIVLVVMGSEPLVNGSRVIGTHHDSPHIDLKARPLYKAQNSGLVLFKTVYYGGIKKYQWSNLPLALMGKIDTPDGRSIAVSIGNSANEPVFVIPDNAPHSDKELRERKYNEVLKGEELDPVAGSIPDANSSVLAQVAQQLVTRYKIREEDLVSAELQLVPAAQPADVGLDAGLVGAFGQDDRLSSFCAVRALLDLKGTPRHTAMAYLSNYEEEGSINNTGAASQLLNSVFAQLVAAQRGNAYSDLDLRRALRSSEVISADVNDGINPLFPETSEETNAARVGYGVTIKRYGHGFDANSEFVARIRGLLERNEIPWQTQTPKVDVGSGSTVGQFLSSQDMEVIDMGVPLLSLHAPYEMSSKVDLWNFYRFMTVFFGS